MKKILKILFYVIVFILVLLVVIPIVFKGKIVDIAQEQINKSVDAQVEFADLKISFFKNFPNLSISLVDLSVVGSEPFEGDTLVAFKSFDIAVDVVSAIKMENIKVKKISLVKPVMNGIILEDGTANWDIVIIDTIAEIEEEPIDTTSSGEFNATISLKKFEIVNANVSYNDLSSGMSASLNKFNFSLIGDFSQDFTVIDIDSKVEALSFAMDGIRYVKNAALLMDINVDANLVNKQFVIKENEIAINALSLGFDGVVDMPNEEDVNVDLKFATKKTSFKSVLSMVPAVYMKDFEDVQTDGEFQLEGKISGTSNDKVTPSAYIKFVVNNAMFKYPDLPESVDNINIDVEVNYNGVNNDLTTVDINKLHLELANNPVDVTLNVATPMSDMSVNGIIKSNLNLSSLKNALPLDETTLEGKIAANLDFMGKLSYIENEQYEQFKADGLVQMEDLTYLSADFPQGIVINQSTLKFSPRYVQVASFDAKIGNSDIKLDGKVENFIPYVFDDQVLKGYLNLNSNVLDANEFMTDNEEPVEEEELPEDTVSMQVIEIPKNIDFRLQTKINTVYYDKLEISNLYGLIVIKDGVASLDDLSMNMLDGSMKLNGEYNTQDVDNPLVDFAINVKGFNIPKAFESFEFVQKFVPLGENATGRISTSFSLTSYLKQDMSPVMSSVVSDGSFATRNLELKNTVVFSKVGEVIKTDKFKNMSLKDIDGKFQIRNGRIFVDPFETTVGSIKMVLGGDQGIDQTMNFVMNLAIPRSELGSGADKLVSGITSELNAKGVNYTPDENVNFIVDITGTVLEPIIKPRLGAGDGKKEVKEAVKEAVKNNVTQEVEKKKEEVKKDIKAEADKIIKEAEVQAANVRAVAKKSADLVRKEADANAKKVMDEATNTVAKKLAEPTAQKIKDEGYAKAAKIESEADTKAKKIISEAKKKAAALE